YRKLLTACPETILSSLLWTGSKSKTKPHRREHGTSTKTRQTMVFRCSFCYSVAPHLTVVTMHTTAQSGVAMLVRGVHAAWVGSSMVAAHETTAVPAWSRHDR